MNTEVRPTDLYRLPWSLNDNVLSWLEPTKRCNLYCEGCYSTNDPKSDKTLEQVREDLEDFVRQRTVDSISVAGGDPLVHPEIEAIVRMIRHEFNLKPVLNTNGLALTPELLRRLKAAGVHGFTFHIDSSQGRPGWKDKNEIELNELRLHYAEMVEEVGGLTVAFNSTVFPHTLKYVPALVEWAREHIDIVHNMVFILFRTMRSAEFDYFAHGKKIDGKELVYYDQERNPEPLRAADVINEIRKVEPEFQPAAYLGGTKDPDSLKWLLSGRLASKRKTFGYIGPRYMELVQTAHHIFARRYLAYVAPELLERGRSIMAGFSLVDSGTRRAARSFLKRTLSSPKDLFERVHYQTLLIIQPIDFGKGGETNMCDGCPDMTIHKGELVWSCRLDEKLRYGCFLTACPRPALGSEALPILSQPRAG